MEPVFVSYSHQDANFVDRLVQDLCYSDIPATYDKWLLKVGDSIIERIAEAVTTAASVVAIVSSNSVKSEWVKKELSLAMTREVKGRAIRVFPAVIDDCDVPASISDKLFADFRKRYYWGLQRLLEALDPRQPSRFTIPERRRKDHFQLEQELEQILSSGDSAQVRDWIKLNPQVLLLLFGRRWALSRAIQDFPFGESTGNIDYLVANGQSFRFFFHAVSFGPVHWSSDMGTEPNRLADGINRFVTNCTNNFEEFCRAASIRFSEDQIGPPSFVGYPDKHFRRHKITGTLLLGRRHEYREEHEVARQEIFKRTEELVEIASYDRLLDAIRADANVRRHQ